MENVRTGKEIRNIEGHEAHDTYMDGYQNYVPRKRKITKAARKWKAPTNKPKEFKFSANTNQSKTSRRRFHVWKRSAESDQDKELTACNARIAKSPGTCWKSSKNHKKADCWSRFGKFRVETKKIQGSGHMGHTTKKRRNTASTPRKINPYELRNQELKIEEGKQAKRNFFNWKRRQQ